MNKAEARVILESELGKYRYLSYQELSGLIDSPRNFQVLGPTGCEYQLEVQAFWDQPRKPGGDLRIIASIDDGGLLSALIPLTQDFIITPEGKFVGE
jgi:hypothetical protein